MINSEYLRLSYRRAIIVHLMDGLREDYLALASEKPNKEIQCEGVFQQDSLVPPESIAEVIEELERAAGDIRVQLSAFTFERIPREYDLLSGTKTEESRSTQDTKEKGGSSKGRRRSRNR
jgi:hypothetical protein